MAINAATLTASLLAAAPSGGFPLLGQPSLEMAASIAQAVASWAVNPVNLSLTGISTGTSGVGQIVGGKLIVPPSPALVLAGLAGAGLNGPLGPSLATMVGLGLASGFSAFGFYQGQSATVGIGADASKIIVANPGTLTLELSRQFSASMRGPLVPQLAAGLGTGISMLLLTGTGIGTVVGTPTVPPVPAAGPSFSTVV